MYGPFPFENIELSPCFASAISFFNVDERRAVSDFDEVPALNFDDILRYPTDDDDEFNKETEKKGEEAEGVGLGLLFDGVSQTYACSRGGNAENIFIALPREGEEGVVEGTNLSSQYTRGIPSANPSSIPQTPCQPSPSRSLKRGGKAQDGSRTPSRTVIHSRVQPRSQWYSRPYMTGTDSDGYMRPPRGGVPPELARKITRDNMVQDRGQLRKRKGEDGYSAGRKKMRI